jgi:hypothetical protein
MDKEKLIQDIMKDLDCSREDAEEVAEMEIKAKGIKRYEKAEEQKPRKPRERKIDQEKERLIELFNYCLMYPDSIDDELPFKIENVYVKNNQKEILFNVGQNEYSLILTKHRPPKK